MTASCNQPMPLPAGHTHSHDPHVEGHITASETVRDVVIGMSDGLTVPFALMAGLSGAVTATHIVVTAGLAEIVAGSIAMGLGGYLAAKGDEEHYVHKKAREQEEIVTLREREIQEVVDVLVEYSVDESTARQAAEEMSRSPEKWVDFMMRFELGLDEPDPKRALRSAATIAASYIVGGLIPLGPYFFLPTVGEGFRLSCVVTLIALAVFGVVKGRFSGVNPVRGMVQTVFIGGLAATAAYFLARLFSGS